MKAITTLFLIIIAFIAYADQVTKETIAIIDFDDLTNSNLGAQVAEFLRTAFVQTNQFTVVERAQLEKVLKEQKFTISELVDPANAAQLGKLLGATYIITGSITKFGSNWLINARFIDVNTAQTTKAAQASGKSEDEFIDMMNSLVKQLSANEDITHKKQILSKGNTIFEDNFERTISEKWELFSYNNVPISTSDGNVIIGTKELGGKAEGGMFLYNNVLNDIKDYQIEFWFGMHNYAQNYASSICFLSGNVVINTPFYPKAPKDWLDFTLHIYKRDKLLYNAEYDWHKMNKIRFEREEEKFRIFMNGELICSGTEVDDLGSTKEGFILAFLTKGVNIMVIQNVQIKAL